IALDSKSGLQAAVPYYWNIAPNRDATFIPSLSVRRGAGVDSEVRYLEPSFDGESRFNFLPYDGLARGSRYSLRMLHDQTFSDIGPLQLGVNRVSDDDYWKDFPRDITSPTPRLLGSDLRYNRSFGDWAT